MEETPGLQHTENNDRDRLATSAPLEHSQSGPLQSEYDPEEKATKKSEDSHESLSSMQRALILGPVTMTYFLWFLDLAVVSTATPTITSQFDSLPDVGWYGGGYQLGASAVQPLTGKIFQKFSTKWTFLTYFFIFMLGSAVCGAAQSSNMLIIGRAIAGVGSAGIGNGALTIISAVLPPRGQARFLGINQGIGQLGLALGPILGGLFTEYVSWRWCKSCPPITTTPVILTKLWVQASTSIYRLVVSLQSSSSSSASRSQRKSFQHDRSSPQPSSPSICPASCLSAQLPSWSFWECSTEAMSIPGIAQSSLVCWSEAPSHSYYF